MQRPAHLVSVPESKLTHVLGGTIREGGRTVGAGNVDDGYSYLNTPSTSSSTTSSTTTTSK